MARNEKARKKGRETSLLDRRSYLKLAGSAAASVAAFGTSSAMAQSNDIILQEDFADSSYADHFSGGSRIQEYDYVTNGDAHSGDSSLRVDLNQGSHYGISATVDPQDVGLTSENLQEMYVSYWVKFGSDFETSSNGGKLPGPRNRERTSGGGSGVSVDGTNGWTARGAFFADGGDIGVGYYSYHMDMSGSYGDFFDASAVPRGEWHHIEQYVKLNTVSGGSANRDGELKMWVNGDLGVDRSDMRFTLYPENGVNYNFIVYYGGSSPSPADNHLYFDDWTIARSRVSSSGDSSSSVDTGEDETKDSTETEPSGTVLELSTPADSQDLTYDFTVEGSVQKRTDAGELSAEDNDEITDNGDGTVSVSGISGMGQGDSYLVDGTVTSMSLDESLWTIRFDGEEVSVADLTGDSTTQNDDEQTLPNTLVIDGRDSPRRLSTYEFSVSGSVEKSGNLGSVNAFDTAEDGTIKGRVVGGKDGYRFSGEITSFTLSGPATVHVQDDA